MVTHPAQAHRAGPAQVKIYKINCSEKGPQPTNLHVLYKLPQRASFWNISAGDINLRRRFLTIRTSFNITAAAAADVTTVFAGLFSGIVRAFIILIFRRRPRYLDACSSLHLFNQLKRAKEGI
jgi:hypothetical protein